MSRPTVTVRAACPDDVAALVSMWTELRSLAGRMERAMPVVSEEGMLDRLRALEGDPDARALVAVVDDQVAGMAVLTSSAYAPLFDHVAVHLHYLHVRDGFRRRGVGKALLAAATGFADEIGAEHLIASVLPQLRDTNRFYARLGFGPVVVRRSVPVSVLRRRLVADGVAGAADDVLIRRRTLRRVRAAVARVNN